MKFIIFVIDDRSESAEGNEMAAIDAFNSRLRSDGHWVMAAGIGAPETATVIDHRSIPATVDKGSLFGGTEHYSGFWIVEAPDESVALHLATDGSRACNRRVELRPFLR